jgi:AcrR family transcriptional regulator
LRANLRERPVPAPITARKMSDKATRPSSETSLGEVSLGQREKNKIDKLHRIKEAARELFLSKGFDDATTRAIASRAGVGIGTVFIYADNKRDLLFLVANDELEETTDKAEASIRDDASCLQNLLTVCRHHYEFFGRQPKLSRLMLREMTFYDSGRQADRFRATRERVIRLVSSIMQRALDRRSIQASEDAGFIGWVAFCIYQVELRRWLTTKDIDIDDGMAALQRALKLLMQGLMPTDECLIVSGRGRQKARRATGA